MQLKTVLLLVLLLANAVLALNLTSSDRSRKYRRGVPPAALLTPTRSIGSGLYVNLLSTAANEFVKITGSQRLGTTSNSARTVLFTLTQIRGKWALEQTNTGLFVSAEENGKKSLRATRSEARSWESFTPVSKDGSTVWNLASATNGKLITKTSAKTLIASTPAGGSGAFDFKVNVLAQAQILRSPGVVVGVIAGKNTVEKRTLEYPLTLPFAVTFFGQTTSNMAVSTNGYISFATISGAQQDSHVNPRPLPTSDINHLNPVIIPMWLTASYIDINTYNGIFYKTEGTAPNRVFNIEFYLDDVSYFPYQCVATFYENRPGVARYHYHYFPASPKAITVGAQCYNCNGQPSAQYKGALTAGLVIEYNSDTNAFTKISG